jgi:hypothetical protein
MLRYERRRKAILARKTRKNAQKEEAQSIKDIRQKLSQRLTKLADQLDSTDA